MRPLLAVAFLGISLAFTASAALAADQELRLPQGQQQEVVMVDTGSGSAAVVDTDQSSVLDPHNSR